MTRSRSRRPHLGTPRSVPKLVAVAALVAALVLAGCSEGPDKMLDSAKEYLSRNDLNAASIQLKNALQKDGSLAEARFLLGSVYLEQGDYAGSVRELRRAISLGFPDGKVVPLLAEALLMSGEFDRVIDEFSGKTLEDKSGQSRLLVAIGDAHIGLRQVDKAQGSYRSALDADAANVAAWVGLGRSKFFTRDFDGALADADAALAVDANASRAQALRADVFAVRNQRPEAIAALDEALRTDPRAVNYHFSLISMLLASNDLDGAEQRLAAMQKVAGKHPSTLYLKAFVDFRRDRLAEARDGVEEVLRQMPGHLPAELLAGSVYLRLEDHVRAQSHLERVLARVPGQPLARRLMAGSMLATGNPARAKEIMEPILEAGQDDTATLNLAGQIYLASGDFERASDYFAQVSAANPEDVRARTRLGLARLAGGDSERALADLEAAAGLDDAIGQPDIALILAHLRAGELDKALAAQQQLERKQPDHPQTHNLKGGILMARQDLDGARTAFERALELDPEFLSSAVNLARLDIAQGNTDVAKQRFENIISLNPTRPDPYLLLAQLQSQTGSEPAEVRATIERAIAANPSARAPKLALARSFLGGNEAARARSIAQDLVASEQDDPVALAILAQAQNALGERQQAIATLNRLVRLQPQAPGPLLALAEVQRAAGDQAAAEQSLRRALALRSDLIEAQQRLVVLLVETQRGAEALKLAREVQGQRPDVAVGYMLEGDIHAAGGNWEQAVSAFRNAFDRARTAELAVRLHRAQLRAGKTKEADVTAADWLAQQPQDVVVRAYLAEYSLAQNRLEDAEKLYRDVIELQPQNALVLNNLAWVAGRLDRADAIVLAERALALAPDNPAILDTLGMLQVERGEHEKGLANLRKAVDGAPNLAALRLNLARAYSRLERKADASREFDEVLRLAPEGSPLHQEATRLKEAL
jgi:cellulose synthase operon protein C